MKYSIILFLLFGIQLVLSGQSNNETSSALPLPFENINLFTDRDLYLSGETIWFSAKISLENNQKSVSNILYIELFNTKQRSIVRKKYKINQGFAEGVLDIPPEFLSDVYYLRAYTHFNKNFPVERYFISAIQIINPKKGIPLNAEIKDSEEVIVSPISLYSLNPFPPRDGMQLVTVYKNQTDTATNDEVLNLDLLDYNYQIISSAQFFLNQHPARIAFPDSTFTKPGLYYYVLKDQENGILKIRAFIYKGFAKYNSDLRLTSETFKKRDSVNINLLNHITEDYSHLGIKIAQKGSTLSSFDKLMLFIEDPYLLINFLKTQFNPLDLSPKEENTILPALNEKLNLAEYKNLFFPKDVYGQKWIPGLKDIGLSGIVLDKISQKPLANIPIYLSIFNERPEIFVTISKDDGSFQFSLNSFENDRDALLCPLVEGIEEVKIKVNRDFTPSFQNLKPIPLKIDSSYIDLLEQMLVASQTSKDCKTKSKQQDFSIRNLPYSFDDPDITLVLDNFIETPTLNMIFTELITAVRVRKRNDTFIISVFNIEEELRYKNPLILVDDIPIFDVGEFLKIPPKAIEKIEVHNTPFYIGNHTIKGIIKISTLTDNFGGMNMDKSSSYFKYQTLSPNYNFITKSYESIEKLNSRTGDFRTLLYWNPKIENVNQPQNFYTSDQSGDYETYLFGTYTNGQSFQIKLFNLEVRD